MWIIFILITYLFSSLSVKPYLLYKINILSITSIIILIISCGILLNFEDSKIGKSFKDILDIFTLILNILFIIYIGNYSTLYNICLDTI